MTWQVIEADWGGARLRCEICEGSTDAPNPVTFIRGIDLVSMICRDAFHEDQEDVA